MNIRFKYRHINLRIEKKRNKEKQDLRKNGEYFIKFKDKNDLNFLKFICILLAFSQALQLSRLKQSKLNSKNLMPTMTEN